ncbi:MAG: hypothetical protein K9M57_11460, partial [Phycisphaerae bacterium]|nr:hypothetical protein [Phycisphaerae bacterium]
MHRMNDDARVKGHFWNGKSHFKTWERGSGIIYDAGVHVLGRLCVPMIGFWLLLGLAVPAAGDLNKGPVDLKDGGPAPSNLEFISLDVSYQGAQAQASGNILRVSTGQVQRVWALTGQGLSTTGVTDLRGQAAWGGQPKKHNACDWQFPGVTGNGRLISLTARPSNDQGFTSDHLEVVATFAYEADNLLVQYVIWAYPGSEGLRTQCRARLMHEASPDSSGDSEGEGVTDSLP